MGDIDEDGKISNDEMYAFGETLHEDQHEGWSAAQVQKELEEMMNELWGRLDVDGDQHCDLEEFCYFYRSVIYDQADDQVYDTGIEFYLDCALRTRKSQISESMANDPLFHLSPEQKNRHKTITEGDEYS